MGEKIDRVRTHLKAKNLDAILISSYENILYLTNYTNFPKNERDAYIVVTKKNAFLITDPRYSQQTINQIPHLLTREKNAMHPLPELLQEIRAQENIKTVGFEAHDLTVAEYIVFKKLFHTFISIDISSLRKRKDKQEILSLQKACKLTDKAFSHVVNFLKAGITEKEVAYHLETYIRQHHAELSFPTIVAFGSNAAIPHHMTSNQKLTINKYVLIDFGVRQNNYCSDITRTIYFGNKPTQEEYRAYQTIFNAQLKAVHFITEQLDKKATIYAKDVDAIVREYLKQQRYPDLPHALGHGIGLAVHESPTLSPKSKDVLENDVVFTLEPGIYIQNQFGIRIEDDFVIQENKLLRLSHSSNKLTTA